MSDITKSVKYFLNSGNPLSDEAFNYLLNYHEEDDHLDYKETFNPSSNKEWVGITIDAMAFSNSSSGYILFGVEDKTYKLIGLGNTARDALSDINMLLQKLNRYVRPKFYSIRTKLFNQSGLIFVLMYIPESIGKTHITTSDVSFDRIDPKTHKNKPAIILRKGMIYIRQSGGNHEIDVESFEKILDKRIIINREFLLENIAKVIEAPSDSSVIILKGTTENLEGKPIEISGNKIQISSEGLDADISIKDDHTSIALYISQFRDDKMNLPDKTILWNLYMNRKNFEIGEQSSKYMTIFSLLLEVPAFYWTQTINKSTITKIISDLMEFKLTIFIKINILHFSAILGKDFYDGLIKKHKSLQRYLEDQHKDFPQDKIYELYDSANIQNLKQKNGKLSTAKFEELLENILNGFATNFSSGQEDSLDKRIALSIDCFLYSKNVKFSDS